MLFLRQRLIFGAFALAFLTLPCAAVQAQNDTSVAPGVNAPASTHTAIPKETRSANPSAKTNKKVASSVTSKTGSKISVPTATKPATEITNGVQQSDILPFLEQVITWERLIADTDTPPVTSREILIKENIQANAKKILRSSFDFAREEAVILAGAASSSNAAPEDNQSRHARLLQRAQEIDAQITQLKGQIDTVTASLRKAHAAARSSMQLEKEKLEGQLKLAQAEQGVIANVLSVYNGGGDDDDAGGFGGQVSRLARTVQDELNDAPSKQNTGTKSDAGKSDAAAVSHDEGIVSVFENVFAMLRKQKDINQLIRTTSDLRTTDHDLTTSIRSSLQTAIKQGNDLSNSITANDPASIATYHASLNALIAQYKTLSAAVIPLGQVNMLLDTTDRQLHEWNDIIDKQWHSVLRNMIVRLVVLSISLLIPFVLSELAKRAIQRYVQDVKRQRQLKILRQIIFSSVIFIMLLLNFVTEFGSLATYAGFLTAGLAVALQTVLLSLTAHFFFFGRFGVRPGDRVTISGVTGDVIQVGMMRIYMMELVGDETELRPSGKIVAFPNSVLFNATAFSKQVSGTSYGWNDLTFLIDPTVDFSRVSKLILEAVDAVYSEYKEAIELQHSALVESTRLSIKVPAPKGEIKLLGEGLAYVVHYPIVLKRNSEIHARLMAKLYEKFQAEHDLHLVIANPIRINAVVAELPKTA